MPKKGSGEHNDVRLQTQCIANKHLQGKCPPPNEILIMITLTANKKKNKHSF